MWTITADSGSLLSVVKFDPQKAPAMAKRHGVDPEQDYLLIRARVKQSLEYMAEVLEAIYKGEVEGWEKPLIDEDKTADYQYRSVVTPDEWKTFLCFEVDGITYSSHVKEATRDRAPEGVNRNEIYTAMMATWSAWVKLQPNKPWGNWGSYTAKPDCTCGHTELSHSVKGDSCRGKWDMTAKKQVACNCKKYTPAWPACTDCKHPESEHTYTKVEKDGKSEYDEHCTHAACTCLKYNATPKSTPAPQPLSCAAPGCGHSNWTHTYAGKDQPRGKCNGKDCTCSAFVEPPQPAAPVKSAAASAAVFLGAAHELTDEELEEIDELAAAHRAFAVDDEFADTYDAESGTWHKSWCVFLDGDKCICTEPEDDPWDGVITVREPAVKSGSAPLPAREVPGGVEIAGQFIPQEPPTPGETKRERKNRQARNRRARRAARLSVRAAEAAREVSNG